MIPLFVADRTTSLRILGKLNFENNDFGILAHPYTSSNFKEMYRAFHCRIKVCDSGIYQGDTLSYEELFSEYSKMGATHGIIKDYYRDRRKTAESARNGLRVFKKYGYSRNFQLVGVAQGNSVAEYLQSYGDQKKMGLNIVAIGGLLDIMPPEVKIAQVRVRNELFIQNVIRAIRQSYTDDILFPLGVFNRRRFEFFKEQDVWASDYKGWIFKYNVEQSHSKNDRFEQIVDYIENKVFSGLRNSSTTPNVRPVKQLKYKNRLLVMSCGKSKRDSPGKAIDVYLGPAFRMVKKYLKYNNNLDVKIISAKYGVIDYKDKISPYNIKMGKKSSCIYEKLAQPYILSLREKYDSVFILGGKYYQSVIPDNFESIRAKGKIGQQLSDLKCWLSNPHESTSRSLK